MDVEKILLIQKRCIRFMAGVAPRESCRRLFAQFNILTVTNLYILKCACFVKNNPELFLNSVNHNYEIRNNVNFNPMAKTSPLPPLGLIFCRRKILHNP